MKKCLLYLLLAVVLLPVAAFAEDDEMIEDAERQLEMTNIQLERQRAELDFNFQQQMRELEIEKARLEIENAHRQLGGHDRHGPKGPMPVILLVALLNRILTPIWIYKDMRRRNASSVILVLLGILGGLFGLLVYAVVRMGDINTNAKPPRK